MCAYIHACTIMAMLTDVRTNKILETAFDNSTILFFKNYKNFKAKV